MKKLLLAFEGTRFPENAFEFARKMNEIQPVFLTGIFLPQADYANLWSYTDAISGSIFIPFTEDAGEGNLETNIEMFENLCKKYKIACHVHRDFYDFALPQLKKETRFADLLIFGVDPYNKKLFAAEPNEHLQDILHQVECPVLVVPDIFEYPVTNILSYDGSESSVYAIKQFAYLFPEMANHPTLLVYAGENKDSVIPEKENIEELAARHFPSLTIMKLDINPGKYFNTWLSERKSAILISGAFGRSSFSLTMKKSFISEIINEHKLPLFITHR